VIFDISPATAYRLLMAQLRLIIGFIKALESALKKLVALSFRHDDTMLLFLKNYVSLTLLGRHLPSKDSRGDTFKYSFNDSGASLGSSKGMIETFL
jgi:hypothetical protein